MTLQEVMIQLESYGTAQNRKIYTNHGCDIDMFGVSMANLKKVLKPIKKDKELGRQLFLSSNMDAIYLSQWIVEPNQLSDAELEDRILFSHYYMLIEIAIPCIIAKDLERSKQLIAKWLDHEESRFRQAAYSLYSNVLSLYPNEYLNLSEVETLLEHIQHVIHDEDNRVRYAMNQFVIAAGAYVTDLFDTALDVGKQVGKVKVNMGRTSCKVPFAPDYLDKIKRMNRVGQKRKS